MKFDGMSFDYINGVVRTINDQIEHTEDHVGMAIRLNVVLLPIKDDQYCSINVGDYILWDSEEERRDELDDGNLETLYDCLLRRTNEYILTVSRISDACMIYR